MLILLFTNEIYFIFLFVAPPRASTEEFHQYYRTFAFLLNLLMKKCSIPLEVLRLVAIQNKEYNEAFVLKVKVCHLTVFTE